YAKYLSTDPQSAAHRMIVNLQRSRENGGPHDSPFPSRKTIGWQPTCTHDAPSKGCTVFDPFVGSGTVVQVAQDLGRIGVGIDLKADYLKMAKLRTAQLGFGSL